MSIWFDCEKNVGFIFRRELETIKLNQMRVEISTCPSKSLASTSGYVYAEETMSCSPVPGMTTILSCAEKPINLNENSVSLVFNCIIFLNLNCACFLDKIIVNLLSLI